MKLKKVTALIIACILFCSSVTCFASNDSDSNRVISFNTPTANNQAELAWSLKLGTSYKNSPSPLTVVNDTVIVMSGKKLYKLNSSNGKIIKSVDMADCPSYSYTPVTYANGVIYCPLNNAKIQAFDYRTMKPIWIYTDSLGGQSMTEITYNNGYIYTGFWNSEDEYANYVCIDTRDENKSKSDEAKGAKWTYKSLGGFYWAGCKVIGKFVVFGTDDGTGYDNRPSKVVSIECANGKITDTLSITGDQRSAITYNNGRLYFVTKAGYFYSVKYNPDGSFADSSLQKLSLGGASTSSPVIYNGRAYVGVQGKGFSSGYIKVIDLTDFAIDYSVSVKGYPQNSVLVSDAYVKKTGKIYIYTTYNSVPGGITVITDSVGQTTPQSEELFTPDENSRNYCICSITADEDGTLFYKNDSGYIFAVANKDNKTSWFVRVIRAIINFIRNLF